MSIILAFLFAENHLQKHVHPVLKSFHSPLLTLTKIKTGLIQNKLLLLTTQWSVKKF